MDCGLATKIFQHLSFPVGISFPINFFSKEPQQKIDFQPESVERNTNHVKCHKEI